jgi:hypothetical protein
MRIHLAKAIPSDAVPSSVFLLLVLNPGKTSRRRLLAKARRLTRQNPDSPDACSSSRRVTCAIDWVPISRLNPRLYIGEPPFSYQENITLASKSNNWVLLSALGAGLASAQSAWLRCSWRR